MRFLTVTAYVWLGLAGAGVALAIFGLQKQPILVGELAGATIGCFVGRKEMAVNGVYTALSGIGAVVMAIVIVSSVLKFYL